MDKQSEQAIEYLNNIKNDYTEEDHPLAEYYVIEYAIDCIEKLENIKQIIENEKDISALCYYDKIKNTINSSIEEECEWKPNPNDREWDYCTACGIGCKRREYGTNPNGSEYVTEYSYRYCPNCGKKVKINTPRYGSFNGSQDDDKGWDGE